MFVSNDLMPNVRRGAFGCAQVMRVEPPPFFGVPSCVLSPHEDSDVCSQDHGSLTLPAPTSAVRPPHCEKSTSAVLEAAQSLVLCLPSPRETQHAH